MSSLRPYAISPERIVSEARMNFSGKGKYTFVVEGESDFRLLRQWLIEEEAVIKKVDGKPNAVEVWNRAVGKCAGVVCVVDMDYDPLIGSTLVDNERFIYVSGSSKAEGVTVDGIDLEATLMRSSAFAKFLINRYRGADLHGDLSDTIRKLRERLRAAARDLGAVRAADARSHLRCGRSTVGGNLDVDELFFDAKEVRVRIEDLSKLLLRSSRTGSNEMEALLEDASRLRETYASGWELCRGHDLSQMLALHLGIVLNRRVSRQDVEIGLREACELEVLESTHFGDRLSRLREVTGKELFGHPPD